MHLRWTLREKLAPSGDRGRYRTFQAERMSHMQEEKQSIKEEEGKLRKEKLGEVIEGFQTLSYMGWISGTEEAATRFNLAAGEGMGASEPSDATAFVPGKTNPEAVYTMIRHTQARKPAVRKKWNRRECSLRGRI